MKFDVRRDDNAQFHGEILAGRIEISGPEQFAAAGTVEANGRIQLWAGAQFFATGHLGDRGRIEFLDLKGIEYHGQTRD